MPVIAKDSFARVVQNELLCHFRTKNYMVPTQNYYVYRFFEFSLLCAFLLPIGLFICSLIHPIFYVIPVASIIIIALAPNRLVKMLRQLDNGDVSRDKDGRLLYKGEQLYHTRRSLMIIEGSAKRTIEPDYWVDRILELANEGKKRIVISDCRYPNEIERVVEIMNKRNYRVLPLRINFDSKVNDTDASDTALDDYPLFTAHIFNQQKGLADYHADIATFLEKHKISAQQPK